MGSVIWFIILLVLDGYYAAAICRRGHVIDSFLGLGSEQVRVGPGLFPPPNPRCQTCGAQVLTTCPSCSSPLQGRSYFSSDGYKRPAFCRSCGAAFPWASGQEIVWAVENKLDEEPDLAEGERRALLAQLDALVEPPTDAETESRWKKALDAMKAAAPTAYQLAAPIIRSVATQEILAHLHL